MPTISIPLDGTPDEKLTALCGLAIQQQGHIALLTQLVAGLYAFSEGLTPKIASALVDQQVAACIEQAADDFRKFILDVQINRIQQSDTPAEENPSI